LFLYKGANAEKDIKMIQPTWDNLTESTKQMNLNQQLQDAYQAGYNRALMERVQQVVPPPTSPVHHGEEAYGVELPDNWYAMTTAEKIAWWNQMKYDKMMKARQLRK